MTREELQNTIHTTFMEIYAERHGDNELPELNSDTVLLESGMDSLGFAILVTQLEDKLGYDPFTESDEAFYPQTYKEFVDFYHRLQNATS